MLVYYYFDNKNIRSIPSLEGSIEVDSIESFKKGIMLFVLGYEDTLFINEDYDMLIYEIYKKLDLANGWFTEFVHDISKFHLRGYEYFRNKNEI